jgi:TonB family protein
LAIPLRSSARILVIWCFAFSIVPTFAQDAHRAVVTRVSPIYPELARRMRVSGKVVLLVTIQANGTVSATKVESGHALLSAAAEDAVRRWRFAPDAAPSESEIEVNFKADGQ